MLIDCGLSNTGNSSDNKMISKRFYSLSIAYKYN